MLPLKDDKRQAPKKSLGQNFLQDKNVLNEIADSLHIKNSDVVIEIGPGRGELTEYLLALKPKELILIEKDDRLAQKLNSSIAVSHKNLKIINGDALKTLPPLFTNGLKGYRANKLVGNIPYYITGQLFRVLGELENKPKVIVLMIQKEVAERVCAKSGDMNILAASVQIWADCEIIKYVGRDSFYPKPKVDSAVIKMTINDRLPPLNYYKLIKLLFKQPRKTIWNNLKESGISKINLEKINIDPNDRPEKLSIESIIKISNLLT